MQSGIETHFAPADNAGRARPRDSRRVRRGADRSGTGLSFGQWPLTRRERKGVLQLSISVAVNSNHWGRLSFPIEERTGQSARDLADALGESLPNRVFHSVHAVTPPLVRSRWRQSLGHYFLLFSNQAPVSDADTAH